MEPRRFRLSALLQTNCRILRRRNYHIFSVGTDPVIAINFTASGLDIPLALWVQFLTKLAGGFGQDVGNRHFPPKIRMRDTLGQRKHVVTPGVDTPLISTLTSSIGDQTVLPGNGGWFAGRAQIRN